MALPEIIIWGCFSINLNCTIPTEVIHDMSELKFNGEGQSAFHVHLLQVMTLCHRHQIKSEDVWAILLTLTFEGHVKHCCHTLPIASISSFDQFTEMMIKSFDKYSHRDVCEKICCLRMEPDESVEDFADRFLHIYCEIPYKILNSDFLRQEFRRLVRVS